MDPMVFESEDTAADHASTTPQPPIVLAMDPTDSNPYQSIVEPKADEESGTVDHLATTPDGSSESNADTEIRELD